MDNKEKYINDFKKFGQKYGFPVITLEDKEVLTAKNTDGEDIYWIFYNPITETISYRGNTDNCNIWFCDTRKDFTPEKTIQFIYDLNKVFELEDNEKIQIKELIDPEDWQEIANVNDAYNDIRYNIK